MRSTTMIRRYFSLPTWIRRHPLPGIELADYPVRTSEKLRFADTDRNGHVSNVVFAVCCQNARMELLHDRSRIPLPTDTHFVIARLELEFLGEMHWPGTVEIGTRVERIGRSSVTVVQALFLGMRRVATAKSIVALVDRSTRRATPLPQETAAALRALASTATTSVQRNGFAAPAIPSRLRSTTRRQPDQQTE